MQKIGEKIVYNTNEEILDPSHTALVLWDVLQAFEKIIFNKEEFSKNLNSIVELARKSNIPIFFTSVQTLSKRFESSANIYTVGKLGFDRLFEQFAPEDMDFAIKPKQEEIVINKHTASIFVDTGFERMLRNARYYYCSVYRYCHRIWSRVQCQRCFQQRILLGSRLRLCVFTR